MVATPLTCPVTWFKILSALTGLMLSLSVMWVAKLRQRSWKRHSWTPLMVSRRFLILLKPDTAVVPLVVNTRNCPSILGKVWMMFCAWSDNWIWWGLLFLVLLAGKLSVPSAIKISFQLAWEISLRRAPVSNINWNIGPHGYPIWSHAAQMPLISF